MGAMVAGRDFDAFSPGIFRKTHGRRSTRSTSKASKSTTSATICSETRRSASRGRPCCPGFPLPSRQIGTSRVLNGGRSQRSRIGCSLTGCLGPVRSSRCRAGPLTLPGPLVSHRTTGGATPHVQRRRPAQAAFERTMLFLRAGEGYATECAGAAGHAPGIV